MTAHCIISYETQSTLPGASPFCISWSIEILDGRVVKPSAYQSSPILCRIDSSLPSFSPSFSSLPSLGSSFLSSSFPSPLPLPSLGPSFLGPSFLSHLPFLLLAWAFSSLDISLNLSFPFFPWTFLWTFPSFPSFPWTFPWTFPFLLNHFYLLSELGSEGSYTPNKYR